MTLINPANILTLTRLLGIPIFCLTLTHPPGLVEACVLGALLLSDFFDGWAARRFSHTSHFGSIFDPITDRLTTAFLYLWLWGTGLEAGWLALVIALRHISQTLSVPLLIMTLKKRFHVRARAFPKWVTGYNSVYVFFPLFIERLLPENARSMTHLALAVPMAACELKILVEYWRRFFEIANDRHDTFE